LTLPTLRETSVNKREGELQMQEVRSIWRLFTGHRGVMGTEESSFRNAFVRLPGYLFPLPAFCNSGCLNIYFNAEHFCQALCVKERAEAQLKRQFWVYEKLSSLKCSPNCA
jgi:hypothetical protein